MNTHVCDLINQHSTGLFVSYSTHGKTQLYKIMYFFKLKESISTILNIPHKGHLAYWFDKVCVFLGFVSVNTEDSSFPMEISMEISKAPKVPML